MEAEIGIIGGSGFYSLLEGAKGIEMDTKYGRPSGAVQIGNISGKKVAFIPRHGEGHTIPPHKVPYRANIQALHDLGVSSIIATNAVGSLNPEFGIGQIVAFSQFVNSTHGRDDTFFDEDVVAHVSTADPYCGRLRSVSAACAGKLGLNYRNGGSVVVVNGPRFSTKAESAFFMKQGFDMINMTQYPEAALARERCMCYMALGMVTDYDAGLVGAGGVKPVSHREIMETFGRNVDNVKGLVSGIVKALPQSRSCSCASSLDDAIIKLK
ncbi:MAG: S-methyl-5'-thioadenosine phosphorylase [Candidatus Micrarchaeaceae archaeon]